MPCCATWSAPGAIRVQPRDDLFRRRHAERADDEAARIPARRPARAAGSRALEEWTSRQIPRPSVRKKRDCCASAGVTRLSLGVQSWDDALLKTLGRVAHRRAGGANVSTAARHRLRQSEHRPDVRRARSDASSNGARRWRKPSRSSPNTSLGYCLTYEEDTEYFRKLAGRRIRAGRRTRRAAFRDDDGHADRRRFRAIRDLQLRPARPRVARTIAPIGWARDYLGFGPSAFSTVGLRRWQNVPDTAEYMRAHRRGESSMSFEEPLARGASGGAK